MSWTAAVQIRDQKVKRAIELAQRANITDVEKARAIKDKYVALLNDDPSNEKNQRLYRWSLSILLGARALAGERIGIFEA
jgi:isocitrate dehydrogenase kinase/phosphatase